jgi:3',5'-cyclic AMP phosphodiesterase CpdA
MSEFRLVQVADLHLGADADHHLDNWRKVAAWIKRERPDMVVVNGDMVMSDPDDDADHQFAREQIDKLDAPLRFLPGNHDVGDNVLSGKMAQRVNGERLARFKSIYGADYWSFSAAGWGFIGLNAMIFGSDGLAAEEAQWAWLETTLQQMQDERVALFVHKPLFLDQPAEPDSDDPSISQSCLDRTSRLRLLALATRYGVKLISCGHKHQTRTFSLDGIYHFWGPSTACVNGAPTALHWGAREVGFIDYRFHDEGFEHRVVGADFLFRHENYVRKLARGDA